MDLMSYIDLAMISTLRIVLSLRFIIKKIESTPFYKDSKNLYIEN